MNKEGFPSSEMIIYDLKKNIWKILNIDNKMKPKQRYHHNSVIVDDKIIIFGGMYLSNKYFNDLWVFNINDLKWKEILINNSNLISPRVGFMMVFYN
jgi:hypothetical protein